MRWREVIQSQINSADRIFVMIAQNFVEIAEDTALWLMRHSLKRELSWAIDDDGDLIISEKENRLGR